MPSSNKPAIYLDHAAGTPCFDELLERARRYHRDFVVNPHGGSCFAEFCRRAIIKAEERLLACIGSNPDEASVIWTSGGTEALNLAVQGFVCRPEQEIHCEAGAHAAMLVPFQARLKRGQPGKVLPLTPQGQVLLDLQQPPALLALSHVNNETGAIQDLAACRRHIGDKRTALLVDAAQSLGKCPIPWQAASIDLLAISGRKIGGPQAVGALVVRRGHALTPQLLGGGQQRGMRSGTVDTIGVLLFADAAEMACAAMPVLQRQHQALSRRLHEGLTRLERYRCRLLSPPGAAPHIAMLAFEGYEGAIIMRLLAEREQILVGTGSACSAESKELSHVLKAMAVPEKIARGAIRVSLGPRTSAQDIDALLAALERVLARY
ncbi:MAG: aminotransferase class V-fold PLP-dependent enzyme [Lentisphaerae bacterium]|jgi:cysteine desulfurase|nr:aminotransferase class V-fold PLP-dependent enzyme [Lentisphaerota bacterium]